MEDLLCDATVIVPAHDAGAQIGAQLAALAAQRYDGVWEVLVVDNGSTDDTATVALRWAGRLPGLRVIREDRLGVNYARNAGARVARGEILAFCDADDVATPSWLGELVAACADADIAGGYLDQAALNSPRAQASRLANPTDRLPLIMDWLPYATGACMAVRATVFDKLGGFDETYADGGGDDVELCLRAQFAGHTVAFAPGAVMRYRLREGLRQIARQQFGYGRADARLFRDFRGRGLTVNSTGEAARGWLGLLLRAHVLGDPDRAGLWVCEAAWRAGRLRGSLQQRVWCP
ncbi:glycosyltransferase [Actinoplanes hulinensis]|uniref:Glycosyltransferase n=1 Tax=Actinoplanes hulinensis TaxID=1144547 RepID=A0ABS7AZA9_9ACTN|nr:glycosyltransferase [Actinoplanes hulinensis]MBW6433731.1 glycosyltransferase [Actinoplanes hulinensis]